MQTNKRATLQIHMGSMDEFTDVQTGYVYIEDLCTNLWNFRHGTGSMDAFMEVHTGYVDYN